MFVGFIIGMVIFILLIVLFKGIMEMDEGGFIMALAGGFIAAFLWTTDNPSQNHTIESSSVLEVNVTALQNVVDLFEQRIDILEKKNCTCEPVMVIESTEATDPYGTGY